MERQQTLNLTLKKTLLLGAFQATFRFSFFVFSWLEDTFQIGTLDELWYYLSNNLHSDLVKALVDE